MKRASTKGTVFALFLFAFVGFAIRASAGQSVGSQAATSTAQPGAAAPVVTFDPQGVDLAEAVRITLQNAANIKLAEATARQQYGVAQEQTGAFDPTLQGTANHNYQRQNLTSSAFQAEQLKRTQISDERNAQQGTADKLRVLQAQLVTVQNLPAGQDTAAVAQLRALDPTTAANLEMIDALATSNIGDPALKQNLRNIRSQLLSDSIANAQAGVIQAQKTFTQLDQLVTNLGFAPTQEYFFNGGGNLSLSRLFRVGITFAPFLNIADQGTNYLDKAFPTEFGGKGIYTLFTNKIGFNATIPLARGLGAEAVAAPEHSSLINSEAARLDAQHQASSSALDTINAYWSLRAAQDSVVIAQQSVEKQTRIVDLTRQTISAGDLPAVELARVQASEARARSQLRSAESSLQQARVALATAMGVAVTDDDHTLPLARDPFPAPPDPTAINEQRMMALATAGLQQRRDVTAAVRRQEASQVFARGAELNMKPRVDFSGGTWYTSLDEAVISKAFGRWVGPSYNLMLDIEKPFGNNTLRGQYLQAQAGSATSDINSFDLQRQVRLNVVRTIRAMVETSERVRQAEAAVNFYQQTIDSEIERFRIGEVTLIDTITTESQQADARRALLSAQQDMAQLIAELRFQTGTLVPDPKGPVSPQTLITVPER